MPASRIIVIVIVFICILCIIFTGPAMARSGGSSSSVTGSPSTGEPQTSGAGGSSHGGGIGQGRALKGGISNAPRTGQIESPVSSISFPAEGSAGTGYGPPQFSGGPNFERGNVQQSLYAVSTPDQYGWQTNPYGYGDAQSMVYSGRYGAVTGQAPATGGGQSVQALAEPGAGESCMSSCTESYTPYECSTRYCAVK